MLLEIRLSLSLSSTSFSLLASIFIAYWTFYLASYFQFRMRPFTDCGVTIRRVYVVGYC